MITRPNFNKLTQPNSQFDLTEQRFNHDAIAVYLHEKNKRVWKNRPVYLVAGSEDLRDLLTRLPMQFDGDEAFIFYRSHIHAIVISLLRLNGKLIAYYYDPQAWGEFHHPTLLAYDVLTNTYPDITIFASSVEIQDQDNQRGCTEYALDCLEYLLQPNCNWMNMLQSQRSTKSADSIYLLDKNVFPQVLKDMVVDTQHKRNQNELETWLAESYVDKNGEFQWQEVERVTRVMQGADLPQWLFDGPKLYTTSIDLNKPSITLTFTHDSYVRGNCLTFTKFIFPTSRCDGVVLDESQHVKTRHDTNAKTLTFTADSVEKLLTEFTELAKTPGRYLAKQMRQQQGLKAFANDMTLAIQIERELVAVMNNTKGGMDPRQVQLALQFIFRNDQATIYVPHFVEMSGENTKIDLDSLKKRDLKTLVSTLPVDDEHQVAMKIDLTETPFNISIYNSSQQSYSESRLKKRLNDIFGNNIVIKSVTPHFKKQTHHDLWACGVHVIANIEAELGRRACAVNEVLNVTVLARTYLRAWRHQQEEDEKLWNYRHTCIAFTEKLYKAVKEATNYPTASIVKFLSGYIGTKHTELRRATPIAQLVREYDKSNSSDTFGVIVLRFCNLVFPTLEMRELSRIFDIAKDPATTKGMYEYATKKYSYSDSTDKIYDAVVVDLQLLTNQQTDPLGFLRAAVTKLLVTENPAKVIEEFFKFIDCDYPTNELNNQNRFLQLMILEVCSQAAKYDGVLLGAKRNMQIERTAKDERIKKMLVQLGVYQGEMTPEVNELLQHPENVIINITSKIHLAILSVVTDLPARMAAIRGFIKVLSVKDKTITDVLDQVDASLRSAAAEAVLATIPEDVFTALDQNNYNNKGYTKARLYRYILSNSVAEHTKIPEKLVTRLREWKAAGVAVSIDMLDDYKKHMSNEIVRQLFEIIVGNNWTRELLEDYVKFLKQDEYFSAISKIVWQADARLLVSVLKSNFHRFNDEEAVKLVAGFKGSISRDQVTELFGCRNGYSTVVNSTTRYTKFDYMLCESLFENRHELLNLRQFYAYSSPETLAAVSVKRSDKLAAMIETWDDASKPPIRQFVADYNNRLVGSHLALYADVLRLDEDIVTYITLLPKAERTAAAMRCHPPTREKSAIRDMLGLLRSEDVVAYIGKHLDQFNSVEVVAEIITHISAHSFVLTVIEAKKGLFKGERGRCNHCDSTNCNGSKLTLSGPAQILRALEIPQFHYDALMLLVDQHRYMSDFLVTLKMLPRDKEINFLSTYHAQLGEVIKRSDSNYIAKIGDTYGHEITRKFIEMYYSYFNADNLANACIYHPSFTSKALMRGKPLLKNADELMLILRSVPEDSRYLILQRNIGLLNTIDQCIKIMGYLSSDEATQFLIDYKNEIIAIDRSRLRSQLQSLFSLSVFTERKSVCMAYLRCVQSSLDFLTLLGKPCLSDDDRLEAMLQTSVDLKGNLFRCVETVTQPHRDMLKLLSASLESLKSVYSSDILTCFEKILPRDMLVFLQTVMLVNQKFTAEHALRLVARVPLEDRFDFISRAIALPGKERWQLLRQIADHKSFVALACRMINSGDDILQFAIVNHHTDKLLAVVREKHNFVSSQNLISLMQTSTQLRDYLINIKLGVVKSHELLRQVLKEVPSVRAYKVGQPFITDFNWLVTVMSCLGMDEAEGVLETHDELVVNDCNFARCLPHIKAGSRLAVAIRYQNCVRKQEHFENVLLHLSRSDCYAYVCASTFQPEITASWLTHHLTAADRYEYLSKRDVKEQELLSAINSLQPEHRLLFACEKISVVQSPEIFRKIHNLFEGETAAILDIHRKRVSVNNNKSAGFWQQFSKHDEKKEVSEKKPPAKLAAVVSPRKTEPVKKVAPSKGNSSNFRNNLFASPPEQSYQWTLVEKKKRKNKK